MNWNFTQFFFAPFKVICTRVHCIASCWKVGQKDNALMGSDNIVLWKCLFQNHLFCLEDISECKLWIAPPTRGLYSFGGIQRKGNNVSIMPSNHTHVSLCHGPILVFHKENPPPAHFSSFLSLSSLFNHCMNLHAWISSLFALYSSPLIFLPSPTCGGDTVRDLGCLQMDSKGGCTDEK